MEKQGGRSIARTVAADPICEGKLGVSSLSSGLSVDRASAKARANAILGLLSRLARSRLQDGTLKSRPSAFLNVIGLFGSADWWFSKAGIARFQQLFPMFAGSILLEQ